MCIFYTIIKYNYNYGCAFYLITFFKSIHSKVGLPLDTILFLMDTLVCINIFAYD